MCKNLLWIKMTTLHSSPFWKKQHQIRTWGSFRPMFYFLMRFLSQSRVVGWSGCRPSQIRCVLCPSPRGLQLSHLPGITIRDVRKMFQGDELSWIRVVTCEKGKRKPKSKRVRTNVPISLYTYSNKGLFDKQHVRKVTEKVLPLARM